MAITVLGPFALGTGEVDALDAELAAFTSDKGVKVLYEEYHSHEYLVDRVTGSDPPEIIILPQPGALMSLAPHLVDLEEFVNPRKLRRRFGDYLIDLVSIDEDFEEEEEDEEDDDDDMAVFGGPIKLDLKSLVWYKPAEFAAAGYTVPTTFDELIALSDRMVADGRTPFCNYIGSGPATGWVGTDWIEDLVLGADGPMVYDEWVDHAIPFTDARIEMAFERYKSMIDTPGYVFDRANMLTKGFYENAAPMIAGDCMMHKQASFFSFFIQAFGGDISEFSTFKFPSVLPAFAESVTGGGVYMAAVKEAKGVRKLSRFMLSRRFGREALAPAGGWLMPNVKFDTALYPDDLTRSWADTGHDALEAGLFRFDASDVMPPQVGAGSFWSGIIDLVAGTKTIPQVLADIDATWPT